MAAINSFPPNFGINNEMGVVYAPIKVSTRSAVNLLRTVIIDNMIDSEKLERSNSTLVVTLVLVKMKSLQYANIAGAIKNGIIDKSIRNNFFAI
jgi:hypothetical protein